MTRAYAPRDLAELPTGIVTMLFTDIEGSTPLVHRLGARYGRVLNDYQRLLRRALSDSAGHEVDCRADEFFAVFQGAQDGVAAAVSAQRMFVAHAWPEKVQVRVRMGLHTGEPAVEGQVYLGIDVHQACRVCAAGHGGQILLSESTSDLVADGVELRDLGTHVLAGVPRPEPIFQLVVPGLPTEFPPLRVESGERRRLGRPRKARAMTLAESAWQVRRLLPEADPPLQQPLAELGGALFTADRALNGADHLLERVDDKRLARSLAAQRKLAALGSQRAKQQTQSLQAQTETLETLRERRRTVGGLASDLPTRLDALRNVEEIDRLRHRVVSATEDLDHSFTQTIRLLDRVNFKLKRTRHRSIFRSDRNYVVPWVDEAGTEKQTEFETMTEARDFRNSLRAAERAQKEYQPYTTKHLDSTGASGEV